jgi:hypothetical protein
MYSHVRDSEWWERLSPEDFDDREDAIKKEYQEALVNLARIFFNEKEEIDEDYIRENLYTLAQGLNVSRNEIPKTDLRLVDKKKHDWEIYTKAMEAKESKEFVSRNVKLIHNEIYGADPLDYFNVAGSMANLLWHCNIEDVKTPKKMNIQRKV